MAVSCRNVARLVWLLCLAVVYVSLSGRGVQTGVGGGGREQQENVDARMTALTRELRSVLAGRDGYGVVHRETAGGKTDERRSLIETASTVDVRDADLFPANLVQTLVASFQAPPFDQLRNGSMMCISVVMHIAVNHLYNDRGVGPLLYLVLQENCFEVLPAGGITLVKLRYSIRQAGPGIRSNTWAVITYWWLHANGTGEAALQPTIINPSLQVKPYMAVFNGIELSRSGSHLILAPTTDNLQKSKITFLDVKTGSRTSYDTPEDTLQCLAFDSNKTRLLLLDQMQPRRILSVSMTGGGDADGISMPVAMNGPAAKLEDLKTFAKNGRPNISDVQFGAQSVDPQDRCLYFTDYYNNKLWSMNISNPAENLTHVAGTGEEGQQDGDFLSATFENPYEPVVTRDGCNVFLVQSKLVRWIKLSSPCGRTVNVTTVAKSSGPLLRSVALLYDTTTGTVNLLLGSFDGKVLQLVMNKSALHNCAPSSPANVNSSDPNSPIPSSSPNTSSPTSYGPSVSVSPPAPRPKDSSSGPNTVVIVALLVSVGVALIVAGLLLFCFCRRRSGDTAQAPPSSRAVLVSSARTSSCYQPSVGGDNELHPAAVQEFALAELRYCTSNFNQRYRIGEKGAFGEVYWGEIKKKEVALKLMIGELTHVKRKQFIAEVNTLSRLHHANLIELIGYCQDGNCSILVYPFFSGGSLSDRLHKRTGANGNRTFVPLTLTERASIASQIANGLTYLHIGANPPVIHRDIKSSNILLTDGSGDNLRAVLADFGLATMGHDIFLETHESFVKTSHLAGTQGYMAPEYLTSGRLTVKVDVYAFGVIILELLTARKVVMPQNPPSPYGEWLSIVHWVRSYSHLLSFELLRTILDQSLMEEVSSSQMKQHVVLDMIRLAMDCVSEPESTRPEMSPVQQSITAILSELKRKHT